MVGLVVTVSVLSIGLPMVVFSRAILVLVFLQVLLFAVSEVIKSDILYISLLCSWPVRLVEKANAYIAPQSEVSSQLCRVL